MQHDITKLWVKPCLLGAREIAHQQIGHLTGAVLARPGLHAGNGEQGGQG
jgi:hypothetical protein